MIALRNLRPTRNATLAVLAAVMLTGCAALEGPAASDTGRPFDDAYVQKIQKGTTTMAQIRQNIGEPWQTNTTSGHETWTYHYSNAYANAYTRAISAGLYRKEPINRMLVITFAAGKVVDYSYTK